MPTTEQMNDPVYRRKYMRDRRRRMRLYELERSGASLTQRLRADGVMWNQIHARLQEEGLTDRAYVQWVSMRLKEGGLDEASAAVAATVASELSWSGRTYNATEFTKV